MASSAGRRVGVRAWGAMTSGASSRVVLVFVAREGLLGLVQEARHGDAVIDGWNVKLEFLDAGWDVLRVEIRMIFGDERKEKERKVGMKGLNTTGHGEGRNVTGQGGGSTSTPTACTGARGVRKYRNVSQRVNERGVCRACRGTLFCLSSCYWPAIASWTSSRSLGKYAALYLGTPPAACSSSVVERAYERARDDTISQALTALYRHSRTSPTCLLVRVPVFVGRRCSRPVLPCPTVPYGTVLCGSTPQPSLIPPSELHGPYFQRRISCDSK